MDKLRILARVTIDETHGDLLEDLLAYRGRKRAKRIVYLAAIGKLFERGGMAVNQVFTPDREPHVENSSPKPLENAVLRPFSLDSDDLAFLRKLSEGM